MKKHIVVLCFLIVGLLTGYIQTVFAVEKTYKWEKGVWNEYQISIIALDNWQPDTPYEIIVRLTMTSNGYDTKTNSVKVILSSETFVMDSLNQEETPELTEVSDYWEKKFVFHIPAEKLGRGQTLNTTIVAIMDINEVGWREVWDNYDDKMTVNLNRPLLSTLELGLVAIVTIVIGVIILFAMYRKMRIPKKLVSKMK